MSNSVLISALKGKAEEILEEVPVVVEETKPVVTKPATLVKVVAPPEPVEASIELQIMVSYILKSYTFYSPNKCLFDKT